MKAGLSRRLALILVGVAAVSVAITAAISFGLVRQFAQAQAQRDLERLGRAVAAELAAGRLEGGGGLKVARRLIQNSGALFAIARTNGAVEGSGESVAGAIPERELLLSGKQIKGTVEAGGEEFVYAGFPSPRRGGPAVILMQPIRQREQLGAVIFGKVLVAGAAAAAIAILISSFVSRRFTQPIKQLSEATRGVARGDLSQQVEVTSGDELGELARNFNQMSKALAEARRRESEFLENVSHELRTPLTSIQGYAEALADSSIKNAAGRAGALAVIRTETQRLNGLISDVTDLARLQTGELRLTPSEVDLAETLREAAGAHAADAAARKVKLEVETSGQLSAVTDAGRVRQVISNLIDNALRVTPPAGAVTLRGHAEPGGVVIEVVDTGPGTDSAHLPHVFERSYLRRVSGNGEGRPTSGLGLAIVRQLVQALAGAVEVTSEPGKGTVFRVMLPRQ